MFHRLKCNIVVKKPAERISCVHGFLVYMDFLTDFLSTCCRKVFLIPIFLKFIHLLTLDCDHKLPTGCWLLNRIGLMKILWYNIQFASYNKKIIKKPMQKLSSKIWRSKVPVITVNNMSRKTVTSEKQGKGD